MSVFGFYVDEKECFISDRYDDIGYDYGDGRDGKCVVWQTLSIIKHTFECLNLNREEKINCIRNVFKSKYGVDTKLCKPSEEVIMINEYL